MSAVVISGLTKSYGAHCVLSSVEVRLEDGGIYCLMAPSGSGKTTLFRIMLGLEQADEGSVEGIEPGKVSVMFQEDRLCEDLTPVENVILLLPKRTDRSRVRNLLGEVLPSDCLSQPVCELSGGMRRRVSLVRAIAYPSQVVVLDEPFTGLDYAMRRAAIDFIVQHRAGRTLLVATHGQQDAQLLGATLLHLDELTQRNGTNGAACGSRIDPDTAPAADTLTDNRENKEVD
ncbi:MAG: ABC transporter ATP-binding protein [Eggerthellaceae bacterium]|nr:ABC transporter ATP-binding protein [Eggerthellaceae bacterium]